jgi:hypothetical protein
MKVITTNQIELPTSIFAINFNVKKHLVGDLGATLLLSRGTRQKTCQDGNDDHSAIATHFSLSCSHKSLENYIYGLVQRNAAFVGCLGRNSIENVTFFLWHFRLLQFFSS